MSWWKFRGFWGILQRSRDINVLKPLEKAKFIYTVSAGDSKASAGMAQVGKMLKQDKVSYAETEFSAKLPQTEQDAKVQQMLAQVKRINFIRFAGTLSDRFSDDPIAPVPP